MFRLLLIGGLAAAALLLSRRSAGEREEPRAPDADTAPSPPPPPPAERRPGRGGMSERERAMRDLADELMFQVEKRGSRYTLIRDTDVAEPVRRDRLTLKDAEELLANWKLRGFHGG